MYCDEQIVTRLLRRYLCGASSATCLMIKRWRAVVVAGIRYGDRILTCLPYHGQGWYQAPKSNKSIGWIPYGGIILHFYM